MMARDDPEGFYDGLPRLEGFEALLRGESYAELPDDWLIASADVIDSTGQIEAGHYKTVNMVGAAVIAAVSNALGGAAFPFVFGGDGASLAVWPAAAEPTRDALARVRGWAVEAFGLHLRAALVPLADIRAAGSTVRVARHQASQGADYAMFTGGGLTWVDARMKEGRFAVPPAPAGALPDLTGLSCRWSHMPARQGTILSLVALPIPGADPADVAAALTRVVAEAQGLERGGNPARAEGPGADWPPAGATLEAQAARGHGALGPARRRALFESFVAWVLIRTGLRLGGFDARRYARVVGQNADFRKLDDGLKMTIDCDPGTAGRIEAILAEAAEAGLLRYGLARQEEAMMTCIVPSPLTDDHIHFIDGAAGGYTLAASRLKAAGRSPP